MKNKLIVIGHKGIRKCYLNIPRDVAITQYTDNGEIPLDEELIDEIDFDDSFEVYDAWN